MNRLLIHQKPNLVEVSYRPELAAVYLKRIDEYDEGTGVRDAVLAALRWVRANDVKHWVADVSTSPRALSDVDYQWVSGGELRSEVTNSILRKFVLLPPSPASGQGDAWVADWEANTLAKFGDRITAKVCQNIEEVRAFLMS